MTGSDPPFLAAGIPEFNRIIADSDLDGLCAAAVLKAANPNAEVQNVGSLRVYKNSVPAAVIVAQAELHRLDLLCPVRLGKLLAQRLLDDHVLRREENQPLRI